MTDNPSSPTDPKSPSPAKAPAKASKGQSNANQARARARASVDDIDLLDSKTAAALLGVKTQTLYAYVSRGLIKPAPRHGAQASLYHREDIEALRAGGRNPPNAPEASERSPRWGQSGTIQTAITAIKPDGPHYRGKSAVNLAQTQRPFEDCVDLLWNGVLPTSWLPWRPAECPPSFGHISEGFVRVAKHASSWQLLAFITQAYSASVGRNPELCLGAPILAARYLIQILAPAIGLLYDQQTYLVSDAPESIAHIITRSLGIQAHDELLHALNACLILSADHELAPATLTARTAASAGADVFSCVSSALGSFDGPLTGYGCNESERILRSAQSANDYVKQLTRFAMRNESIPGFNHPLYPEGDPRADYLLDIVRSANTSDESRAMLNHIDTCSTELEARPSLAIGLVAICAAFKLPQEAPGAIMALGRLAGWLAHVFEQRLDGQMLRPRTKYIGPTV